LPVYKSIQLVGTSEKRV